MFWHILLENNLIKYITGSLAHNTPKAYSFSQIEILIIIVPVCNGIQAQLPVLLPLFNLSWVIRKAKILKQREREIFFEIGIAFLLVQLSQFNVAAVFACQVITPPLSNAAVTRG